MSRDWKAPFRILREQFLDAAKNDYRINLALASFTDHNAYSRWYDKTIQAELLRESTTPMNRGSGQRTQEHAIGTVWGQAEGVRRFDTLAKEAGYSLPVEYFPPGRLFPSWNELLNVNPGPVTLWLEFLFITRWTNFREIEDRPTKGCRIARLDGSPFLASATAIDQFLLSPEALDLEGYLILLRTACPWLANIVGGFPVTPLSILKSPVLQLDFSRILHCAVELGQALAHQNSLETTQESRDGTQTTTLLMPVLDADQAVETASDRLLCRLNPRMSGVRDWSRQLDLADASLECRQAVRTLGLALADIRGEWKQRGQELLADGAWHLWVEMPPEERASLRNLLVETHRLWGWPVDAQCEPEKYTGPRPTLSDARVIDQNSWRTMRAPYLDQLQQIVRTQNVLVDTIHLPNNTDFDIRRNSVKATRYALPSVCPHADPKLPTDLRPEGDMLAEIEQRFRELGLIESHESIHWVGLQERDGTRCRCELAPTALSQPRSAEWNTLRELKSAIVDMMRLVDRYLVALRPGYIFTTRDRLAFDMIAERVLDLSQDANLSIPSWIRSSNSERVIPYGPTALPVLEGVDGFVISNADTPSWLSNWRAVRVGIDARLEQFDRAAQHVETIDDVDTRDYPLVAPAGTSSPLREAFESIASVLTEAADFRRTLSDPGIEFRERAHSVSAQLRAADQRYAEVELHLQAVADGEGCAHRQTLSVVRGINDAIGHVMLGVVPEHMAVAHLRQVPTPDVAGLLRRMREQVSRAARVTNNFYSIEPGGSTPTSGVAKGSQGSTDEEPSGDANSVTRVGRPPCERKQEVTNLVRKLRASEMPWKEIPDAVFKELGIRYTSETLRGYLKSG